MRSTLYPTLLNLAGASAARGEAARRPRGLGDDQRGKALARRGDRLRHPALPRRDPAGRLETHLADSAAPGGRTLQHRHGPRGERQRRRCTPRRGGSSPKTRQRARGVGGRAVDTADRVHQGDETAAQPAARPTATRSTGAPADPRRRPAGERCRAERRKGADHPRISAGGRRGQAAWSSCRSAARSTCFCARCRNELSAGTPRRPGARLLPGAPAAPEKSRNRGRLMQLPSVFKKL